MLALFTRNKTAFGRAARLILAALALLCLCPGMAQAATIRVCLQTAATDSEFAVRDGFYEVRGGNLAAETLCEAEAGDIIRVTKGGSGFTVYLNGQKQGSSAANVSLLAEDDEDCAVKFGGKVYRGSFSVLTNGYVLNVLDLEYYLYGVVGEEIGYNAPEEALKTQAIVARSYAAYYMGGTYYDVLATNASQVYGGLSVEEAHDSKAVRRAVDDTAGQVLYYDGDLVEAVFSSSAGGYTENNENVWDGNAIPYLRGVESPYDEDYSNYTWQVTYTPAQLKSLAETYMQRIKQSGSFGSFVRLEVSYQAADGNDTVSGRATRATLIGTQGSVTAKNDAVRTMLGLKSTLFKVTAGASAEIADPIDEVYVLAANGDLEKRPVEKIYAIGAGDVIEQLGDLTEAYMRSAAGLISFASGAAGSLADAGEGVTINGGGWGHGVGLSQFGAIGMAADGYTAEEILEHYYGGENPRKLKIDDLD